MANRSAGAAAVAHHRGVGSGKPLREWVPAPGYPPVPGDEATGARPSMPSSDGYWRLTAAGRWRRIRRLATIIGTPLAMLGGCGVLASGVLGPFDPAPGDVYALTVDNDTGSRAQVFYCDDGRCVRGFHPAVLAPGQARSLFNEDDYEPDPVGVADPATHRLLGCLTPPHADSADRLPSTTVRLSAMHPCVRDRSAPHPVATYYHP
jgi:hypothetical protein